MDFDLIVDWSATRIKRYLSFDLWDELTALLVLSGLNKDVRKFDGRFSHLIFADSPDDTWMVNNKDGSSLSPFSEEAENFLAKKTSQSYLNFKNLLEIWEVSTYVANRKLGYMPFFLSSEEDKSSIISGRFIDEIIVSSFDPLGEFSGLEIMREPSFFIDYFSNKGFKPDWYDWAQDNNLINQVLDNNKTENKTAYFPEDEKYNSELHTIYLAYIFATEVYGTEAYSGKEPKEIVEMYLKKYHPKLDPKKNPFKRMAMVANWNKKGGPRRK